MTTLIAVYNSSGCVGRCDAHCYNAHEPECTCICHGRNHGKGRARAIDNTREMAEKILADIDQDLLQQFQEYGETTAQQLVDIIGYKVDVPALRPLQLDLFDTVSDTKQEA